MNDAILPILKEIGLSGFIDIALMAVFIYAALAWLKKKRASFVLMGMILCGVVYLFAYRFNLILTTTVLQAFFAVILVALIVIFQEELRSFFETVAVFSLRGQKTERLLTSPEVDIFMEIFDDLSRKKIGALLVVTGNDPIGRHLEGGVELNGKISEAILLSIFDPHSQGHDGATVIEGHLIRRFGCHLPLSKNFEKLGKKGTRHAAALGLSERSDALCLVVSEETGNISAALRGEMFSIRDPDHLGKILQKLYGDASTKRPKRRWTDFLRKNLLEKTIAAFLSMGLWFVVVHESTYTIQSFKIRVEYFRLAPEFTVKEVEPDEVVATFSGPRNAFHFLNEKNIHLTVKLMKADEGTETIALTKEDFNFPKEINLENIEPHAVKVTLAKK